MGWVISIGKMTDAEKAVRYLVEAVADSRIDYYVGRREAPGIWHGRLAAKLGLRGTVTPEQLRTLLDGRDPRSGEQLGRRWARQSVVGFDVTFSCPKSVSILYALGDERVRDAVLEAQSAAVDAVCSYLQDHAGFGRRRDPEAGEIAVVPAEMLLARFVHRTARPVTDKATGVTTVDPQLHTHLAIGSRVRRDDGSWGQLHSAPLYAQAAAAGAVGQAVLRRELIRRLGVAVEVTPNGCFDVKGINSDTRRVFSKRTLQVEAAEELSGVSSLLGHKLAVLDTRESKREAEPDRDLRSEWARRGAAAGFGPAAVAGVLGVTRLAPAPGLRVEIAKLVGERGLTAQAATFARHDVVRAVAAALPQGGLAYEIEALVDRILGDSVQVVPLVDLAPGESIREASARLAAQGRELRYSTPEMVALEATMLETANRRRGEGCAVVEHGVAKRALMVRPRLSDGQRAMIWAICRQGHGVTVIEGAAGVGKTAALDACREAFERDGFDVIGCALAGRAAKGLEDEAGIRSTTITRTLQQLKTRRLWPGTVLLVDEAGMVGSRQLAELVAFTDRDGAKLVLVGDRAQLQPIDAGAAFRALGDHLGTVEVTETIRQEQLWERHALTVLRGGDVATAVRAYADHDRIRTAATASDRRCAVVRDYLELTAAGRDTVMLAPQRREVARLNALTRAAMEATGRLRGPALTVGEREFRAGDIVLCTENRRAAGIVNGLRGTVTHVDPEAGVLCLDTGAGGTVAIDTTRYDALEHGYALTAHKAQGLTVDCALVVAGDGQGREWAYTALSRARAETMVYTVRAPRERDPEDDGYWQPVPVRVDERLASAWTRSRTKDTTLDHRRAPEPADDGHPRSRRRSRGHGLHPSYGHSYDHHDHYPSHYSHGLGIGR